MPLSIQAALLGIVQGLTEFLPVSSSAHLIIARAFFGYDHEQFGLPFDVAVHVGTAVAVMAYFYADIARMIGALPRVWSTCECSSPARPARSRKRAKCQKKGASSRTGVTS